MDKQQNNQPQDGENGSNGKFPKNGSLLIRIDSSALAHRHVVRP